jgi:PAS domain S-box-containing protein
VLRASEVRYRRLFEAAQDGILILDVDTGRINDVNPFLVKLLGFSHGEMVGKTVGELSPSKNAWSNQGMLERLQRDGYVRYEDLSLETKDGRYIAVEFVSNVYQEGDKKVIQCNIRDITERKLSEAVIHESEEKFRSLFNGAATGIAISTPQGFFLQVNAAYCRMLGYTADELLQMNFAALTHPDDLNLNLKMRDELLAGQRESFVMEKRYLKKSGAIVWTRHSVSATHAIGGEIATLIVIAEDITERKEAEESRNLFRTLIDRTPDAIEVIDPETGRFLDVNATGCERLGYSREEMLSLNLADIDIEKDYRTLWPAIVEEIKKNGFGTVTGRHRRKDGSTFPVEVNGRYIDLNRGYMVAVVRDVTDRRRIEARFRRLVESNVQGVFIWNIKGKIMEANDAFLKLVHHSREDLKAGLINWRALTPPEYAHLDRRALEEIAVSGASAPYEKEYVLQDGARMPVLLGATVFEDNPEEGVCFVLDLTERKKLEQQFLRAQRMESIGTLAGGVAHDLNNILAPIMMSIEILKMTATDPQARGILETIEVTSKRGADIVRQVLSFARGIEGERVEVQAKHLLKDIETIVRDTFPKNIRLVLTVPSDTWTIVGDPTQLHQILLNLCVNSRDAMPGGGSLTVCVENCMLDEHYAAMNLQAKAGHYVLISVTDTGTGMLPEVRDKIFEPFFTTKAVGRGTGLGLSTVMAIVKSHDGLINVYSELGRGTTFKVYLPAIKISAEGQKRPTQPLRLPRGQGETVLVVDDEASILTITGQTLQAFGYRVLTATNGADAVAVYVKHQADIAVVLTDMMMPVMDGPAMIHALLRINPELKIIAASGLNVNGVVTKMPEVGVKQFLTKPYTAATLLKSIRTVVDES